MRQGLIPLPGQQDLHRAVYQDLPDSESSVGTAGGDHDPGFKCSVSPDQL